MRAPRPTKTSTPTLHQAWTRTVATLLALIFCLGMLALAATQYQRIEFEHTTSGFQRETSSLSRLNHALVAVNAAPAVGILYGSSGKPAGEPVGVRAGAARGHRRVRRRQADHVHAG